MPASAVRVRKPERAPGRPPRDEHIRLDGIRQPTGSEC